MYGRLEPSGDWWQLELDRTLAQSPEAVWAALTEPKHLAAWFPTDIEGERAAGAPLRFVFRKGEGPAIDGTMLAYEPPSLLEFRWGDDETLRFELQPAGDGTTLRFFDRFPDLGKAARDAAGWHVCLDVLARHLSGEEAPSRSREQWREVHAVYVERFGPGAATIGPPASHSA